MFLYILILYAVSGFTFTLSTIGLEYLTPLYFVGIRMIAAGFILLGYYLITHRQRVTDVLKQRLPIIESAEEKPFNIVVIYFILILFHVVLAYIPQFVAMQYMSGAKACLLANLAPFVTALFEFLFYGVQLGLLQLFGLCLGFIGFLPIILFDNPGAEASGLLGFTISMPELLTIFAVVSSVIGWLTVKKIVHTYHHSPAIINGVSMFLGGIIVSLLAWFYQDPLFKACALQQHSFFHSCMYAGITLALIVIFSNLFFYNLYAWLLRHTTATWLSLCGLMAPLFAAFTDWLILGRVISGGFILTLIMVITGLYLFYIGNKAKV